MAAWTGRCPGAGASSSHGPAGRRLRSANDSASVIPRLTLLPDRGRRRGTTGSRRSQSRMPCRRIRAVTRRPARE